MLPFSRSLVCGVVTMAAVASSVRAAASLTSIGLLDQDSRASSAFGISPDGTVVVGTSRPLSLNRAVQWTPSGGMSVVPGGGNFSEALAVSTGGAAIVGKNGDLGFHWTAATGMVSLGDLPGGLNSSRGKDVSADGSVVVGNSVYAGTNIQAFRWTAATGMTGLGDLPGGAAISQASGISADGSVIVGTGTSAFGEEAFHWIASTGMIGLGDLPGSSFRSEAAAVSADGKVIVGYSASAVGTEAFRWTAETGMVGLGVYSGGNPVSMASDVSADGAIVVGSAITGSFEAVCWRGSGDIERLWDVLLATGVNPAADGWTSLQAATAVSDDGLTIVGTGRRRGINVGFVAVVPEPASAALLALSAGALLHRRTQR